MKSKRVNRIWANCFTLPFDHTRDLDLGVSGLESEIASSQEWDGQLEWNELGVNHPSMTMILTSVTMLGLADVTDRDQGDFRRRRAVDISSLHCNLLQYVFFYQRDGQKLKNCTRIYLFST